MSDMEPPMEGEVEIKLESDIVTARQTVREVASRIGFSITDSTRIVTAASELARNVFKYGGCGSMHWRIVSEPRANGLELLFADEGPGISDVSDAMKEGFSTGGGLGMGLPGTKRLMDEMVIDTGPDKGTRVTVRKWLKT